MLRASAATPGYQKFFATLNVRPGFRDGEIHSARSLQLCAPRAQCCLIALLLRETNLPLSVSHIPIQLGYLDGCERDLLLRDICRHGKATKSKPCEKSASLQYVSATDHADRSDPDSDCPLPALLGVARLRSRWNEIAKFFLYETRVDHFSFCPIVICPVLYHCEIILLTNSRTYSVKGCPFLVQ